MTPFKIFFAFVAACAMTTASETRSAHATFPVIQQNLPGVSEYVYRGGASPSIAGTGCGTTCQKLLTSERAQNKNTPQAAQLQLALLKARAGTGVLPKVVDLVKGVKPVTAFAGAASIGWIIGSEIGRQRYLAAIPPAVQRDSNVTSVTLREQGAVPASGNASRPSQWEVRLPKDGWQGFSSGGYTTDEQPGGVCNPTPNEPIVGFPILRTPILETDLSCGSRPWRWHFEQPFAPFRLSDANGVGPGRVYDYDGTQRGDLITSWPSQPSTTTELRDRTQAQLSNDDDLAARQVAFALDPLHYANPTATEQDKHDCDLSKPTYNNVDSAGADKYALKEPQAFTVGKKPPAAASAPAPFLRWGDAFWEGGPTNAIDDWGGWGFRHIRAKHGWSTADLQATRVALASGTMEDPRPANSTTGVYDGPFYTGKNGKRCYRRVVVQFTAGSDDGGRPKGIITSYGRVE